MILDFRDGISLYGSVNVKDVDVIKLANGSHRFFSRTFNAVFHECGRRNTDIGADISQVING